MKRHSTRALCGALSSLLVAAASGALAQGAARSPELVLAGGRVMDPESGLDAIRNVGIAAGEIVAVQEAPLSGERVIDVSGLVVAPGFIDLHAHGQDEVSQRLQAMDGVTTALEMEVGVFPVGEWLASREGHSIVHFGATAGHWGRASRWSTTSPSAISPRSRAR